MSRRRLQKPSRLDEVRFNVLLEIDNKKEAIEIDRDQLTMDKNCANISFKVDALRTPKTYVNNLPTGCLQNIRKNFKKDKL